MRNNLALGHFDHVWGYIPTFLSLDDPRSAIEQFNDNYVSGWNRFDDFTLDKETLALSYPDDPDMYPIDKMRFRDETIAIYPHSWVMVLKADGTHEVCRMD